MMIDVIGGSGFIGSYLSRRLCDLKIKFNILDIAKPNFDINSYKFCDERISSALSDALTSESIAIVLAAVHRDDVRPTSLYFDTNVGGAINICKAAESKSIEHIIFTSSVAIYGQNKGLSTEDTIPKPTNAYGESKLRAEEVFIQWQMKDPDRRKLTVIRPTVVFGSLNRGNFYNLIHQIFNRKFLMIGSGDNIKSIAYVENLVDFILYSIKFPAGIHVYNYVDTPDLNMNELIRLIYVSVGFPAQSLLRIPYSVGYFIGSLFDVCAVVLGRTLPISRVRVKKFCADSRFSSKAIENGFEPRFSLIEAVQKTVLFEYKNFVKNK